MKKRQLFTITISVWLSAGACFAFENGYYGSQDKDPKPYLEIMDTERKADRVLMIRDPDHILVARGSKPKGVFGHGIDSIFENYYNRHKVIYAVKSDTKKDLKGASGHGILSKFGDYYFRHEIIDAVQSDTKKDLLVVRLGKPIMWRGGDDVKKMIRDLQPFISALGYKRVLILGGHAFGVIVLSDTKSDHE